MNNITLIGMPGVGKSTIGVVLAKVLGYQFLYEASEVCWNSCLFEIIFEFSGKAPWKSEGARRFAARRADS